MKKNLSNIEKKANLIIKYRKYETIDKCEEEDKYYIYLKRNDEFYVLQLFNSLVGIDILRKLNDKMKKENIEHGIIITNKKYTYYSKAHAGELDIELIPTKIPTFDIFKHNLLSDAELLAVKEKEKIIKQYHAQPYQLPKIEQADPA